MGEPATTNTEHRTGLLFGMPDDEYHGGPELSQSAMKTLLESPARYRWEQDNPRPPKDAFDFGHVVHAMALGAGASYARIDQPDRRGNRWKTAEKDARDAGLVPLVATTFDTARACADAVLRHPLAGPLITRPGWSEVSMFWEDATSGVQLRGRIDRLTVLPDGTHLRIDVKTSANPVSPSSFAYTARDFSYDLQEAAYRAGYLACTGMDSAHLFVTVESKAPHMVGVYVLDDSDTDDGAERMRTAIDTYVDCTNSGRWPGYTDAEPRVITLPRRYR